MQRDPVHERGMYARRAPAVLPHQLADCSADGNGHFDCRVRVIFETAAGRRSVRQFVHIRRARETWVIESIG